jgi:hypothetical protein
MALTHLRIQDYSDREMLLVLNDVADSDGWADARDIAAQLAMIGDNPHRSVSCRMGWLRKYGAVDREPVKHKRESEEGRTIVVQRWRLTAIGQDIAMGKLRAAQEKAIRDLDDGQLLLMTRAIADRAKSSPATSAKLSEREWRHRWTRINGSV